MDIICNSAGFVVQPTGQQKGDAVGLFEKGESRAALDASAREIPESQNSPARALELWYVRVQSMLISQLKAEVTKEISANLKCLDESNPQYENFKQKYLVTEIARLHSWKLRLLFVPVRAGRINQAAIQMYYSMNFEARQEAALGELKRQWLHAVESAGMYVVSALITSKDYASAISLLLGQFRATKNSQLAIWLTLLHIMVGDTFGARSWVSEVVDSNAHDDLQNLIRFAENDSRGADISAFTDLYRGNVEIALQQLSQCSDRQSASPEALASRINMANFRRLIE